MISEALIKPKDSQVFISFLDKLVSHSTLKPFYSSDYTVYNETDLIGHNNRILRPDRLCIKLDEAVVIDYKTGAIRESHKGQVQTYLNMVKTMGYKNVNGFLVYTNETIQVIEV